MTRPDHEDTRCHIRALTIKILQPRCRSPLESNVPKLTARRRAVNTTFRENP